MRFSLTIKCDNAAFGDDQAQDWKEYRAARCVEVATILRNAAQRVHQGGGLGNLLDTNGNTVGGFGFGDGTIYALAWPEIDGEPAGLTLHWTRAAAERDYVERITQLDEEFCEAEGVNFLIDTDAEVIEKWKEDAHQDQIAEIIETEGPHVWIVNS